ncbi:glycosyltransferase family 2 protein [Balneatrix alpica]|uniref:glycosyltransferase family 2 protein n=1 Tax=Balneatrix alpica TaxID=75684 RepID=UPI002739C161|nr:glycosyltransferase family 2 protein [Balneatrix alpica]
MSTETLPLSAVIIALNEAHNLEACIRSLAFCDEILVVDSGSQDGSQQLCERLGVRFIHQDWLGYGRQKRLAVQQARADWVLCIDADERVSAELAQAIQQCLRQPLHSGYELPRCNRFMGRWLRHGEGYPDWCLRLFDRRQWQWSLDAVHEKVVASQSGLKPGRLQGDLLHESEETLAQYLDKQNRYTSLQAEQLLRQGKQVSAAKLLLSPLLRFIKFYLLRQGFLDGVPGLVHISIGCFNSFIKYAKVRAGKRSAM